MDPRASAAIDAFGEREHGELVELLQALIRLRTVNPPGDELPAAQYVEQVLADAGVPSAVLEPFPGRGSIVARLHGDGTGGDPLLLLSHLDVVPAPPEGWTHDPFGGEVDRGYVWGRGAVDMKSMVAMELAVVRRLAAEARAAGRDPATDPIPGLRRDVIFASTADEEAGGLQGAGWLVDNRPELVRSWAALNEAGGIGMEVAGARLYPIQVAEKGYVVYRLTVRGTWGHGSMPRDDNAALLAAEVVRRLGAPGKATVTPVMRQFFETIAPALPSNARAVAVALASGDPARAEPAAARLCEPHLLRAAAALLRDTISPDVIHAGVKYNVIPGIAEIEVDCRTLPGTDEAAMTAELRRRVGEDLWNRLDVAVSGSGPYVDVPDDDELYDLLATTVRDHDPDGVPAPIMAPFATDAKHLQRLGVRTYGFSPLRLGADDPFLELFHGDDERVSLAALRFGLPVLYDAVRRACA